MIFEERFRDLYKTYAYWIVALVGFIVVLFGILASPTNFDWGILLLSIGANIIVVAVIFFLSKALYLNPQEEVKNLLVQIGRQVEKQSSLFQSLEEVEAEESFVKFISKSEQFLLGGVALRSSIRHHRGQWVEQLKKGAKLRFLVLNPESPDVSAIAKSWNTTSDQVRADIRSALQVISILESEAKKGTGSVEVRLMTHQPTVAFALRNPTSPEAMLRISPRLYGVGAKSRPVMILRPVDNWYIRFVRSCEKLWDDSKPYTFE